MFKKASKQIIWKKTAVMHVINTNNIFYPKYLEDISPELILETLRMIVYSYRHHTLKYKSDFIISLKKKPSSKHMG